MTYQADCISEFVSQEEPLSLEDLTRRIRVSCEGVRKAGLTALDHALNAGDDLNEVQRRVSIPWKRWLRENCRFVAVSTALLYQRLARHRAQIETEMARSPDFTLRDARLLLTTPRSQNGRSAPKPELVAAMKRAKAAGRDEEITASLIALEFLPFLRVMPSSWRPQLTMRLRKLGDPGQKLDDADIKASETLRRALSFVKIAKTDPKITPPLATANRNEALVALESLFVQITRAGLDLNDIAIIRSSVKREKRRAA